MTDPRRARIKGLLKRLGAVVICLLFLADASFADARRRRRRRRRRKAPPPPAAPVPARAPANYALKPLESIGVTKVRVGRTDVKLVRLLGRIPGIRFTPLREVKKLLLFHHDPGHSDALVDEKLILARDLSRDAPLQVESATEGRCLEVGDSAQAEPEARP